MIHHIYTCGQSHYTNGPSHLHPWTITSTPVDHHIYTRGPSHLHPWTITSTPVDHHIYTRGPSHLHPWTITSTPVDHHIYTRGPSHLHPWTITSMPVDHHIYAHRPSHLHPWTITSTPITCTMLTQFKCSWKLYFCPHITYMYMFQPRAHAEALCIVFHVKSVLCQKYSYHFVGTLKQHIPL